MWHTKLAQLIEFSSVLSFEGFCLVSGGCSFYVGIYSSFLVNSNGLLRADEVKGREYPLPAQHSASQWWPLNQIIKITLGPSAWPAPTEKIKEKVKEWEKLKKTLLLNYSPKTPSLSSHGISLEPQTGLCFLCHMLQSSKSGNMHFSQSRKYSGIKKNSWWEVNVEPFDRKEDLPLRAIPEEINIKMNDLQGTVTSFVGKLNALTTHKYSWAEIWSCGLPAIKTAQF